MFKVHGCAPRGIARDRRQQTGRALSPVRGGVDTVIGTISCPGIEAQTVQRDHYHRIVVECRNNPWRPQWLRWKPVRGASCTYEIEVTTEQFAWILDKWEIVRYDFVTHRAHGPGLQNSKPYHRR